MANAHFGNRSKGNTITTQHSGISFSLSLGPHLLRVYQFFFVFPSFARAFLWPGFKKQKEGAFLTLFIPPNVSRDRLGLRLVIIQNEL